MKWKRERNLDGMTVGFVGSDSGGVGAVVSRQMDNECGKVGLP